MKILSFFIALLVSSSLFSQSLSNEVIGSAGDYNTSASASISWTLGEVMTDTYENSSNQLTQGFHQPTDSHVGLFEHSNASLQVFPNPSSGLYNIDLSDSPEGLYLEILDIRGGLIYSENLLGSGSYQVDLTNVESGMYLLNVYHQGQRIFHPIKLQKVL